MSIIASNARNVKRSCINAVKDSKYGCKECGWQGDVDELGTYKETHGGSHGYESFSVCPCCGGEVEELEYCVICQEYYSDVTNNVCDCCGKNGFNIRLGKQYLKDNGCELDFYALSQGVEVTVTEETYQNWTEKLTELFKSAFDIAYRLAPRKEEERMKKYIFEDYEHYTYWLREQKG